MSVSHVNNHICKYKILIENCNINTPANGGEEVNTEMRYKRAKSFLVACQQTISTKEMCEHIIWKCSAED